VLQSAPVFLDRQTSIEQAIEKITAADGAKLIFFTEGITKNQNFISDTGG